MKLAKQSDEAILAIVDPIMEVTRSPVPMSRIRSSRVRAPCVSASRS